MGGEPQSLRRALLNVALGALFTTALWTLVTGDLAEGASFGGIALLVLLAWVVLDRRRPR